jgi:hypothetical protein
MSQVPQPTNFSQSQTLLGLCNYHWRFVKGFNNVAKPLTQLTKIGQDCICGEAQE